MFIARKKITTLTKKLLMLFAIFYFSYHMVSGNKGLLAMFQLKQRVESARIEMEEVSVEKMDLEHRVNMMYTQSLDLDLLDEQARINLGRAGKNEFVYME